MITINLIGAGRVGQTLIKLIQALPDYRLQAVCSSRFKSDTTTVVSSIEQLPAADLFFITVPDHSIEEIAKTLCQYHQNTTLIHCSGSLPAAVLNPEHREGIQVVSVHPPISIVDPDSAATKFNGGVCTIEGDTKAVETLTDLFESFGTQLHRIEANQKAAYHAANAIAANYLVTLADAACQQIETTGMDRDFAKRVIEQLVQSVLDNLKSKEDYRNALTGPILRNDQDVLQDHIKAMKPELTHLYCELGKQTAEIAGLSKENKAAIIELLTKKNL